MAVTAMDRCGDCEFCGVDKNQQMECRRYPPEAVAAPLVAPTIAGAKPRIEWIVQAVRPPVRAESPACGEFRRMATRQVFTPPEPSKN